MSKSSKAKQNKSRQIHFQEIYSTVSVYNVAVGYVQSKNFVFGKESC